jgi:hypothetical protein
MKDKAIFTALAEILEVPNEGPDSDINPYLTIARFVFADDKGAPLSTAKGGLQGIELEDFDSVIKTSLHMPVKMNLIGGTVGNHRGSYVIGHIAKMNKVVTDGTNQLMAEAYLYKEEYPDEINFLKEAHASGEAPGISYEIAYNDSIIKNGVEWIKNLITCAATFVKHPAYGRRTALLALASADDDNEFIQTMKTLVAQAEGTDDDTPIPSNKGGKNVDELEKAQEDASKFKAEAETKSAEVSRLTEELEAANGQISTLNESIATMQRERATEIRVKKFTDAGFMLEADAEKAEKKKTFWLSLSDEDFDEYISDLVSAKALAEKPKEKAEASRRIELPRLESSTDDVEVPSFRFRE